MACCAMLAALPAAAADLAARMQAALDNHAPGAFLCGPEAQGVVLCGEGGITEGDAFTGVVGLEIDLTTDDPPPDCAGITSDTIDVTALPALGIDALSCRAGGTLGVIRLVWMRRLPRDPAAPDPLVSDLARALTE